MQAQTLTKESTPTQVVTDELVSPLPRVPAGAVWWGIGTVSALAAGLLVTAGFRDTALALVAKCVLTGGLVAVSWHDRRTGIVPLQFTHSLLLVAGFAVFGRFVAWGDLSFVPYWGVLVLLWSLRLFGGGDAKLLLALFGLWPDSRLLWIGYGVHFAIVIPLLIWKYRRTAARQIAGGVTARVLAGQFLPTQDDLATGERMTFAFALAGGVFLWFAV